jgi:hypothetical protein
MAYENYGSLILQLAKDRQASNEAEAKARTIDPGRALGGVLATVMSGGASLPAILASAGLGAAGEGLRASTGSSTDIGGMMSKLPDAYQNYQMTQQLKDQIGTNYLPTKFTVGGVDFAPSIAAQYGQLQGLGGQQQIPATPTGWIRLVDPRNVTKTIDFNPKDPGDIKLLKVYQGLGWRKM